MAWLIFNIKVVVDIDEAQVFQTKLCPLCILTIRTSLSPCPLTPAEFQQAKPNCLLSAAAVSFPTPHSLANFQQAKPNPLTCSGSLFLPQYHPRWVFRSCSRNSQLLPLSQMVVRSQIHHILKVRT